MKSRRRTIIIVASLGLIATAMLLIAHPWVQAPIKHYNTGDVVAYTDAITGENNSDIPGESGNQLADSIRSASATINGLNRLQPYLTSTQYLSVADTLSNFLFAHSGASAVAGGIQGGIINQSNNRLAFMLVADRPQTTYSVTVDISDSQSPSVIVEQVD